MRKSRNLFSVLAFLMLLGSCGGESRPNKRSQRFEETLRNERSATLEESPYINNQLSTGDTPYPCTGISGRQSQIEVKTGGGSESDVVVIIKRDDIIVRNAYIVSGDSYTFNLPNGSYQVFFYGGKGWNPEKNMPSGVSGGFVANESFSKDEPITLKHQSLVYELILQRDGNFSTEPSSADEMF